MIIHFTGSAQNLEKDYPFYKKIITIVNRNDGVLAHDWVETAHHQLKSGKAKDVDIDWRAVMTSNVEAIGRADVVIVEATSYTFTQGFLASTALHQKKPTLVISRKPLKNHAFSGLRDRLLTMAEYKTDEDLEKIIADFIRANTISTKDLRFNMFIDRPIYNYLRSVSYETGKNKSEIIRGLINKDINRRD